jgi:hypothetical protein
MTCSTKPPFRILYEGNIVLAEDSDLKLTRIGSQGGLEVDKNFATEVEGTEYVLIAPVHLSL